MKHDDTLMSDTELDRILSLATKPEIPADALARVRQAAEAQANVVSFTPRAARSSPARWLAGLPLAASLMFGLYLGANPDVVEVLPSFAQNLLLSEEDEAISGIEDVEAFAEEEQS